MNRKKTMTLNLPKREMDALEKLAKDMDMSKTGVMRVALRVYQSLKLRQASGEIEWDELFGLSHYRKDKGARCPSGLESTGWSHKLIEEDLP